MKSRGRRKSIVGKCSLRGGKSFEILGTAGYACVFSVGSGMAGKVNFLGSMWQENEDMTEADFLALQKKIREKKWSKNNNHLATLI